MGPTTIEMIKQLREQTGAGVLDSRRALEEANGNFANALDDLRRKAQAAAAKHAGRPAAEGRIEVYAHSNGRIGVMVEINTETDFAARSEVVEAFAHEVALQIAASAPLYASDEDIPDETLRQEGEKAAERARNEGKPEALMARIVEGTLKKYRDQHVLLRQPYIRDDKITMAQLLAQVSASVGEAVVVRRFVRWEIDEGAL
jgi:elongation factor Ts